MWWLDGFTFDQFPVGQTSLIPTLPILKDWLISLELRIIAPDYKRSTMLASRTALAQLINPLNGQQKLIFDEYPNSYFMALRQKSNVSKEDVSPYISEMEVDFACSGPAYSISESVVSSNVLEDATEFKLTSNGDVKASPRWRYVSTNPYIGNVSWMNTTTGETISWYGSLGSGDILDLIMDEYGVPMTALLNGDPATATITAPGWPHLNPGDNDIMFSGPSSGTLETRWRDRWLIGQQ
jgi:hypothetical protein